MQFLFMSGEISLMSHLHTSSMTTSKKKQVKLPFASLGLQMQCLAEFSVMGKLITLFTHKITVEDPLAC